MDFVTILCCLWSAAHYALYLYIVVQLVRLMMADADLTLLLKSRFGMKPESLRGQVVWITGASSGIGEQLACDMARCGCKLILSARRVTELERVKQKCIMSASIKEDDVKLLHLDLVDLDSHNEAAEQAVKCFGQVDILVNNGGRTQRSLIKDTSSSVDKEMFDVNTIGTMSISKAILSHFISRKSGHFVVTSSIAGKLGSPMSATYSASKFALHGWFETLRVEHGEDNIAVTMVCPGPVVSNILKYAFVGEQGKFYNQEMDVNDPTRMSTERCIELVMVAIVNKLPEVWISKNPILMMAYWAQYMPSFASWVLMKVGMKKIQETRAH